MHHIPRFLVGAMLALALVAPNSAAAQPDTGPTVSAQDFKFAPMQLEVQAGDSVTWTLDGRAQHTVTADDASFDSGVLDPGQTFSVTFETPGEYRYYCELHGGPGGEGMAGTIMVVGPG